MKYLIIIILLFSCTMKGELSDKKDRLFKFTDFRDGEVFYSWTSTIHDIHVGFGCPTTYKLVTLKGDTVFISSDMQSYIKAIEIKGDKL